MLSDRKVTGDDAADVIIVGSGAVGLTMAVRLARAGRRVLVCESGQQNLRADWASQNDVIQTGRRHHGSTHGRYRGLGGTTRLWGGQLMPFTASDTGGVDSGPRQRWPIDRADLDRFVDETLQLLKVAPSWSAVEQQWCNATGNPLDLSGNLRLAPSVWLPKPDFTTLFAKDLQGDRLKVLLGHEAIRLEHDPASERITGVTLRRADGSLDGVRAPMVVVAGGTLETARLLLRAKTALPGSPLGRNDHVGKWFFDHLHGKAGVVTPQDRAAFGKLFDTLYVGKQKLLPKVRLEDAVIDQDHIANCAGVFLGLTSPGLVLQDLRSLARRVVGGGRSNWRQSIGESIALTRLILPMAVRYALENRTSNFIGSTAHLGVEVELLPCRESYLALEPGVPADAARLVVNWAISGDEIVGLARFAELLREYCDKAGLGQLALDPRLAARDPSFFDDCVDSSHQMGGARMASSADQGVVDPDCQVFGMPGLYVAGAPVFPSGSFANPTLMAMGMGQRLAARIDHLLG